ncbi:MAG: hypothetical protein EOQ55_19025 [Mesorhizobium sp.]|uniref:C39 family peptidase n=1 Tax=Mesorhizobium sp. TaxID=1871066 RepID=UPI000FE680C9|nr:C39 family peptidase [Mesorhizobium sp.]RWG17800.1 MAG: hypothetical protein EOQ55_19025 [Mesorhizobium sp.]RWI99388.1 MAG: hypothetical protein EOR21_01380 [Mesorhizobium sp.]
MQSREVPYFSQWESPGMTLPLLAEGPSALHRDPLWRRWAVNVCGMACLKMILAARGEIHPTLELARACTAYGGYVVNEGDGTIKGLIYEPFVRFVRERFGLFAETMTNVDSATVPGLLCKWRYFIASVHPAIRWPEREPPSKGGHLVLVTAASPGEIRFHNPSGHVRQSQADVALPLASFDRFFARRGIAVGF